MPRCGRDIFGRYLIKIDKDLRDIYLLDYIQEV